MIKKTNQLTYISLFSSAGVAVLVSSKRDLNVLQQMNLLRED